MTSTNLTGRFLSIKPHIADEAGFLGQVEFPDEFAPAVFAIGQNGWVIEGAVQYAQLMGNRQDRPRRLHVARDRNNVICQ